MLESLSEIWPSLIIDFDLQQLKLLNQYIQQFQKRFIHQVLKKRIGTKTTSRNGFLFQITNFKN